MKRLRKADDVIVIAGKSKGHVGKVLRVDGDKIFVEGANLVKKHIKPNPQLQREGGVHQVEASLHISNVAIYNPVSKKADKVAFKLIDKDGSLQKVRCFKSNDERIDFD
ncbi:MAG: 50S ribosomal protein L24 [Legionella sp.]|nr:50S ribosomal protein L24 [Legionella sp.]